MLLVFNAQPTGTVISRRYPDIEIYSDYGIIGLVLKIYRLLTDPLRQKLQIKLSVSPSYSILTLGQPVPAKTLQRQAPGRVAAGVPNFSSLIRLDLENKTSPAKARIRLDLENKTSTAKARIRLDLENKTSPAKARI